MTMIICRKCGETKDFYAKEMCKKCYHKEYKKEYREKNREHLKEHYKKYREEHKERLNENRRNRRYERGGKSMKENKDCALFLGVHVAEKVLSKVFKDVHQMPMNHPGYDFKCNKGMKVDVKSSVLSINKKYKKTQGRWLFIIDKNTTADYFLCLAFDNRENLNPQHIWLIPGEKINHLRGTSISKSKVSKWAEYELDINKVISCCDTMRN